MKAATLLPSLLVAGLAILSQARAASLTKRSVNPLFQSGVLRAKRSQHIITDCMTVTSETGHYFYKSRADDPTVCGIYITTDADKIIQVTFDYLDVPCASEGLVAFVDGWELNGGLFPRQEDSSRRIDERVTEFCGSVPPRRRFVSHQNAALLQYRVPKRSRGFSFTVNFVTNPAPCDVLLSDEEGIYTLHNFGRASNCSITALFPIKVSLLSLSVGPSSAYTGTLLKCKEQGMRDYLEIAGGADLGLAKFDVSQDLCGVDSLPGRFEETVMCGVSTIRMVSSGLHENTAVMAVGPAGESDLHSASLLVCPF